MGISEITPIKTEQASGNQHPRSILYSAHYAIYALALAISVSIWFFAVHAPLSLDETGSWWMIKDGFSQIWQHHLTSLCFPSYFYTLCAFTKIIGTSEIALRIPSILAMLGAAWLLYLAARELFSRELALVAVIIFCLHPIVIYESIDVRPYAFAVLATNAAILVLLRMRRSDSSRLAALFGFLSALIVSFHYLFALVLPAFVVCFFVLKNGNRRAMWRQFGVAFVVFALAFLPMVPGIAYLFHTSGVHVYEEPPKFADVIWTFGIRLLPYVFAGAVLITGVLAAVTRRPHVESPTESWRIAVCASLALIPLLLLYGVSVATPIHMFAPRHRLAAVPGIALCWILLIRCYVNRPMRLLLCVVFSGVTALLCFRSPTFKTHNYSWKSALVFAEKNASADNSPVMICSDFPEVNYVAMPLNPKTSRYFAPLSYYRLTVPVIPMPGALNSEAIRVSSGFLREAAQKHERFLALAFPPSYPTLDWLSQQASTGYNVRKLGIFDYIKVLEFDPRVPAALPTPRTSASTSPLTGKAAGTPGSP